MSPLAPVLDASWHVALAVGRGQPPGPADPSVVRDDVRRVMGERRFSYEPSLIERFGRWLAERLDGPSVDGPGGSFGGGLGPWFAWLLILLAVVLVVVVTVVLVRSRRASTPQDEGPATETEIEHRRRAADWERDAERWEREGRWKEALRARYRALVRTLVDRRQLGDIPGRTTGELRVDLAATTPDATEAFDTACLLFELAWYADLPTGHDEVAALRQAAESVLAAPAVDRFGAAGTLTDADGDGARPRVAAGGPR